MGNRPSSPRSGAPAAEDGSKSPHTQPESSDHRRRHSFDLEFVPGPSPPKSRRSSRRSLEAAATVEAKEGIEHYRQKASARLRVLASTTMCRLVDSFSDVTGLAVQGISERTVRLSPPPSYGSSCRVRVAPFSAVLMLTLGLRAVVLLDITAGAGDVCAGGADGTLSGACERLWGCCADRLASTPHRKCATSPSSLRVFKGWRGGRKQEEDVPRLAAALSNLSFFTRLSEDFLRQVRQPLLCSSQEESTPLP
jgi:hypothetical protein